MGWMLRRGPLEEGTWPDSGGWGVCDWQVPWHARHAGGMESGGGGPEATDRSPSRPPLPLQDWDYTYVHSFYHCALAMSFVLLLPKVNKKAGSAGPPAKLDCSTLCCACI